MGERLIQTKEIDPVQAWQLVQSDAALLVDVRTLEELTFVGQVPKALHVPWAFGIQLQRNPNFLRELISVAPDTARTIVFLCRSGKRSLAAVDVALNAGYQAVFSIHEGFEGELNQTNQRGVLGGWRNRGLPWTQQ
jgi:rhodanese-related sulfurtransferase